MYINHINKFASAQEIQDALNAGTLANPYVAMTTAGTLDWNTLEPIEYMGVWSIEGNSYTFQILETDPGQWTELIHIAQIPYGYFDGTPQSVGVYASNSEGEEWRIWFGNPVNLSAMDELVFTEGVESSLYTSHASTNADSSSAPINVDYDGVDSFRFYGTIEDPLGMAIINPTYPAEPES